MRKVKTFLHVLTGSIVPQSSYYAKILKSRFLFSFAYFIVLLSFTTSVIVLIAFFHVSQNSPARMEGCLVESLQRVPQNFSLHIKNGLMSTNQEMPLFVWFNCDDKIQLLAVIDERATKKDVFSYGAQMLVTGSEIVLRYKSYSTAFPFGKYVSDFQIDKKGLVDYSGKVLDVVKFYVPIFNFSLLILTPILVYLLNSIYVLLSSLFVFLFFFVLKKKYSLHKTIQIGLHSSSLPLLSSLLFLIFPINLTSTLLLYFSLLFIFQLVAVYEAHYAEPHRRVHHSAATHKTT